MKQPETDLFKKPSFRCRRENLQKQAWAGNQHKCQVRKSNPGLIGTKREKIRYVNLLPHVLVQHTISWSSDHAIVIYIIKKSNIQYVKFQYNKLLRGLYLIMPHFYFHYSWKTNHGCPDWNQAKNILMFIRSSIQLTVSFMTFTLFIMALLYYLGF